MKQYKANALPDVREYLAAERTLLAYIRTGLACMAFGFVVARFALFLKELQLVRTETNQDSSGLSLWFGTALVLLGAVLNGVAIFEYHKLIERLNDANDTKWPAAKTPIITALSVAGCGVLMAIYLVWLR